MTIYYLLPSDVYIHEDGRRSLMPMAKINPSVVAPAKVPRRRKRMAAPDRPSSKDVEAAVYGHIRAMRALGRTKLNTDEIAAALGLSVNQVNQTLGALKKKGVKWRGFGFQSG